MSVCKGSWTKPYGRLMCPAWTVQIFRAYNPRAMNHKSSTKYIVSIVTVLTNRWHSCDFLQPWLFCVLFTNKFNCFQSCDEMHHDYLISTFPNCTYLTSFYFNDEWNETTLLSFDQILRIVLSWTIQCPTFDSGPHLLELMVMDHSFNFKCRSLTYVKEIWNESRVSYQIFKVHQMQAVICKVNIISFDLSLTECI